MNRKLLRVLDDMAGKGQERMMDFGYFFKGSLGARQPNIFRSCHEGESDLNVRVLVLRSQLTKKASEKDTCWGK